MLNSITRDKLSSLWDFKLFDLRGFFLLFFCARTDVCLCFQPACSWDLPIALSWCIPKSWSWWISLKQIRSTYDSDGSSIGLQIKTKAVVSSHQLKFPVKYNTLGLDLCWRTAWEASSSLPTLLSIPNNPTHNFHLCQVFQFSNLLFFNHNSDNMYVRTLISGLKPEQTL